MQQMTATPVGANAQQAYTDTMTALAMQQAAAAAGQQFMSMQPFLANPMLAAAFQPKPAAAVPAPATAAADTSTEEGATATKVPEESTKEA